MPIDATSILHLGLVILVNTHEVVNVRSPYDSAPHGNTWALHCNLIDEIIPMFHQTPVLATNIELR